MILLKAAGNISGWVANIIMFRHCNSGILFGAYNLSCCSLELGVICLPIDSCHWVEVNCVHICAEELELSFVIPNKIAVQLHTILKLIMTITIINLH